MCHHWIFGRIRLASFEWCFGWKANKTLDTAFEFLFFFLEFFSLISTRSYDVIFLAPWETIVDKFKESRAKVLFGAENFCWPDDELKTKYPLVEGSGQKYLNSGMFIGYAANIFNILSSQTVKDTEDDQLFYTHVYLNEALREKNGIKLDHKSNLFQNLNGNVGKLG